MSFLGGIFNPKNILTAVGALSPLGPVAGGAVGRTLGGAIESDDEDKSFNPLFDAAGGAALGGVGSWGAGALGLKGAGAAAGAGAPAVTGGPASVPGASLASTTTPVAQSVGGAGGGFGSGIKGWWNSMTGSDKATLLGQGVSGVGNVYGAYEAGRIADEEEERRRNLSRALTPLLGETLRGMRG